MRKLWHDEAWEEYLYWQSQDKKTLKKINRLLTDIDRNGYQCTGKPEPLGENLAGYWSVRIDEKNRIVFQIIVSHSICLRKRHFLFFSHNFNTAFSGCGVVGFLFVFSVRISSQIRTLLSKSGEKRGKFCQKIIFRGFFPIFQSWKFTARILRLRPPPAPDLLDAESIAPVSFPCIYYFCVR